MDDENIKFPSDTDRLLNEAEFLLGVETDVEHFGRRAEEIGEEEASAWLLGELSIFCYLQGLMAARAYHDAEANKPNPTEEEMSAVVGDALREAQLRWVTAIDHCRQTHEIEFHITGMLIFLGTVYLKFADPDMPLTLVTSRLCTERLAELQENLEKEMVRETAEPEVIPVPDVDNYDGPIEDLVGEYFRLMEELGTYHRNRSEYATDEQRAKHDRLVAIYHRIITNR